MGLSPIDYDVTLMFYFDILGQIPTAYEHDDLFDIFVVSQFYMIYIYVFLCWAWTLKHMVDEMFFVEQGALGHMGN